jgi:hypothetical protein
MDMSSTNREQRHFSRVPFDCAADITCNGSHWSTQLVDICLNGVLLARPDGWTPTVGSECKVEIKLNGQDVLITMEQAVVAHIQSDRVGVKCENIDIDSIAHLRRLVELNLGDPELVNRELHTLING